jgi:hypothetical protein
VLETANDSDDSPAGRIDGDHRRQHERQDDQRRAALPGAVSPCEHHCCADDQECGGEERSAGVREPEPLTEPSPVASECSHATNASERHSGNCPSSRKIAPLVIAKGGVGAVLALLALAQEPRQLGRDRVA